MRFLYIQFFIILCVWSVWFTSLGYSKVIDLISSQSAIMITMLFGSFVAGSTSLGGGAVAFPVFTKLLFIPGEIALIFSLAIQSVGMSAAMFILISSKAPINKQIVLGSIIPGAIGVYLSLFGLNGFILGGQAKFIFSLFSLFVGVVLIVDKFINQRKFKSANDVEEASKISWWIIFIGSFIGGLLSGLIGTGIDFVLFALMIMFFKTGLKTAVATSVCVMAINAVIGFALVYFLTSDFTGIVVDYWLAAIPIVVVGAPLGALACRFLHRDIIFYLLMSLIVLDVASTLLILGKAIHFSILGLFILSGLIWFFLQQKSFSKNRI